MPAASSIQNTSPTTRPLAGRVMALLTVEQAAAQLGTTDRFIRRLRTERRIAVVKLGKHIRIDSDDLDAYIRDSRQEADTSASAPRR